MTKEELINLCNKWAKIIKVNPKEIRIRKSKKWWGFCTSDGIITFNQALLKLPVEYAEYVVVHELLHLITPNHGRLFETLLFTYLPNWEQLEASLDSFATEEILC